MYIFQVVFKHIVDKAARREGQDSGSETETNKAGSVPEAEKELLAKYR